MGVREERREWNGPYHSTKTEEVYHTCKETCTEGNNIEDRYWEKGTDNRRLCKTCAKLQREGNCS